jgi:hypothetical protein
VIPSCASAGEHVKIANGPRQSDVFHKARSEFNGHSEKRESAEEGRRQEAGCEKANREEGDGEEDGGQEAGGEKDDGEDGGGEEARRQEDHREEDGGQEASREEDDGEEAGGQEDGREEDDGEEAGGQENGCEEVDGEEAGRQKVGREKVDGSQDDRSAPQRHQGQRAPRAGQGDESQANHEAEGAQERLTFPAAPRGADALPTPFALCGRGFSFGAAGISCISVQPKGMPRTKQLIGLLCAILAGCVTADTRPQPTLTNREDTLLLYEAVYANRTSLLCMSVEPEYKRALRNLEQRHARMRRWLVARYGADLVQRIEQSVDDDEVEMIPGIHFTCNADAAWAWLDLYQKAVAKLEPRVWRLSRGSDRAPTSDPCSSELGMEAAFALVQQCMAVSLAERRPCNTDNSCETMRSEIRRTCASLGPIRSCESGSR